MLGTCVKYGTNASSLGKDGTYGWSPNIKGTTGNEGGYRDSGQSIFSGAIYRTGTTVQLVSEYNNLTFSAIGLDASRSNSVYINNGKVYPASLALNFIIKA